MDVVCVLSEKPKVYLAREAHGWVLCSGMRRPKRKDGKEAEQAIDPGYYGDNLAAALRAAYRRIILKGAEPSCTIQDIYRLCETVAEELGVRVEGAANRIKRCGAPAKVPKALSGPAARKRSVTRRNRPAQDAGAGV